MGRIGYFVNADNAGAPEDELRRPGPARPRADVLLPRQPGRLLRRRAGLHRHGWRPGGPADDVRQPGRRSTSTTTCSAPTTPTRRTTSIPTHPLYQQISDLAQLTKEHPALRNGAHQHRYASDAAGIYAFSRLHRGQQREYVVALNNSESEKTAADPDLCRERGFRAGLRIGPADTSPPTATGCSRLPCRRCRPWSTSRRSGSRDPMRRRRSRSTSPTSRRRPTRGCWCRPNVGGSSFNEVTFYAKVGNGKLEVHRHRRHAAVPGVPRRQLDPRRDQVAYRAVVRDNAGHQRVSDAQGAVVPAPKLTIELPAEGAGCSARSRCGCSPIPSGPPMWSGSSAGSRRGLGDPDDRQLVADLQLRR